MNDIEKLAAEKYPFIGVENESNSAKQNSRNGFIEGYTQAMQSYRSLNSETKKELIGYIYEFAWEYGRMYSTIGDADKIIAAVKERFQLPEEYVNSKL